MLRTLFFAAAVVGLAACASTPAYGPASTTASAGYSEIQIENNRYSVTYRAPGGADAALLQDYALLRAADITLERGADWFWVDRRNVDVARGYGGSSIGVGVGGGSFGRHSGVGASVGLNFPLGGGGGQSARSATLEIRLGQGPKPDDPSAYDAHTIATNIRSRLAPAG